MDVLGRALSAGFLAIEVSVIGCNRWRSAIVIGGARRFQKGVRVPSGVPEGGVWGGV